MSRADERNAQFGRPSVGNVKRCGRTPKGTKPNPPRELSPAQLKARDTQLSAMASDRMAREAAARQSRRAAAAQSLKTAPRVSGPKLAATITAGVAAALSMIG